MSLHEIDVINSRTQGFLALFSGEAQQAGSVHGTHCSSYLQYSPLVRPTHTVALIPSWIVPMGACMSYPLFFLGSLPRVFFSGTLQTE